MSNQMAVFIDFENVALWAEQEFLDFELTPLMEFLQSRGPVVIKRAYGDWSRFSRYRDELMNNAIDLIQMYSVRAGKNRADIRMAMDALEAAMTHSQIHTFVIVSGDSDFGALVSKLREYGRYTLGIGPRDVTHPLLVKSCDEFVYLETALGEISVVNGRSSIDHQASRNLLQKALRAHGQRGEIPVLASKLKQSMLLMDSAFNEANFGFPQFQTWLESNLDLVRLFSKDLQLYVAPTDYAPLTGSEHEQREAPTAVAEAPTPVKPSLASQYQQVFARLKIGAADYNTRRDVLRDIFRELKDRPGARTTDQLLEHLRERYQDQGLMRSKTTLRHIWQMAFRQHAFRYEGQTASVHAPVQLAEEIDTEAAFVRRAEAGFLYAVVNTGMEIDPAELAEILVNDADQVAYIQSLLDDLVQRGLISEAGGRYRLSGGDAIPFRNDEALQPVCHDIERITLADGAPRGAARALALAKTAMLQRSEDFAASARTYLRACRLQWDAVEAGEDGAILEDLRWYMASYASVKAGELSQIHREYEASSPYYLAFFALVQEDDPLWTRMRGLINPMLSYYWANAGRELGMNVSSWNLSGASPAQIAVIAATHENPELRAKFQHMTRDLAAVNPALARRVANQIRLNRADLPEYVQVAEQIDGMIGAAGLNSDLGK